MLPGHYLHLDIEMSIRKIVFEGGFLGEWGGRWGKDTRIHKP